MSVWSNNRKAIFIHIPKNAGSSFIQAKVLKDLRFFEHLEKQHGYERGPFSNHHTYKMIKKLIDTHNIEIDYNNFYKFAVVRDPWDRMCSLFFHRQRKKRYSEPGEPAILAKGFSYWLQNTQHSSDIFLTKTPQYEWVSDENDNIVCDKICRADNYDADMKDVMEALNLPVASISRKNVNRTPTNYKELYDDSAKRHIKKYFEKDLDTWKFTF